MSDITNLPVFPHTVGNLDDKPNLPADEMKAKFEHDCMTLWAKLREAIPELNAKFSSANIVKAISSSSTDAKVPTAKAVYLAIQAALVGDDGSTAAQIISDWLDAHPEATTSVQDGSISKAKLSTALKAELAFCSDLVYQKSYFDVSAQLEDYYLDSEGTAHSNNLYCLSDYIPVIPNGTYKVAVGTHYSKDRLGGFYDSTKTFISSCLSGTSANDAGAYTIRVPSNAAYVRLCYLKADAANQKINLVGVDEAMTPKDFGAVGDGVTDDTLAFQRAVNYSAAVYVPTSNGEVYLITDTISVPSTCKRIFGDASRSNLRSTGMIKFDLSGSADSVETLRYKSLFTLAWDNEAFTIGGLLVRSMYHTSGSRIGTFLNVLNYKSGSTCMPDKDILVNNMGVTGFYRAFAVCGRGFSVVDSEIVDGVRGGDFYYLTGSEQDSNTAIAREYNQRGIAFKNCRLHSLNQVFVHFRSGHGYGFEMVGCTCDTGSGQVLIAEDEAWNWNVTGNVFQGLVSGPSIDLKKGARNCVIANNVFSADADMHTTPQSNPSNFVRFAGVRGCVVNGNTFRQPASDAIVVGDPDGTNEFASEYVTSNKAVFINSEDNTVSIIDAAGKSVSDYISVSPGDCVVLSANLSSDKFGTAFCNVNKNIVSGILSDTESFLIPESVYWIRVTINSTMVSDYAVYVKKQVNGITFTGNAFDELDASPIRFKADATNVALAGNTDTAGRALVVADSGVTVQMYG